MRESVNTHVKKIKESGLSAAWQKKLIRLLDYLRDISRTFPGLSFRTQRNIAESFGLKKPDTVGIWLKKLVELDIVKLLKTKRSCDMKQTANFVQILPAEIAENEKRGQADPENTPLETQNGDQKDKSFSKTKSNINTTYSRLDETFTPKNVPQSFIKTVKPFFGEAAEIYRLWGKARLAHKKFTLSNVLEDYADLVEDAFKQTVFAYKHRTIRKDFTGYFYGTLMRMFTYKKREETFAGHSTIFNWLEDQEDKSVVSEMDWQQEIQKLMEQEEQSVNHADEDIPY